MTFSYSAGTATPTYAGYVQFQGLTINDGTFKTQRVPPLVESPPLRDSLSAYSSDDGGFAGTAFVDPWRFDLELWMWVPTGPDDIPAALDYLRTAFNVEVGLQTLAVKARGWSDARMLTARVAGPIVVTEPDIAGKKVPRRDVVIPMEAPDPHLYTFTPRIVTIAAGGGNNLINNGNKRAPFKVRFNGPLTNPALVSPLGFKIALGPLAGPTNVVIASGHWIEVQTNPAAVGGVTAVDDTGADQYGNLTTFSIHNISTGTTAWTVTADAGTGNAVITSQDTYA